MNKFLRLLDYLKRAINYHLSNWKTTFWDELQKTLHPALSDKLTANYGFFTLHDKTAGCQEKWVVKLAVK